MAGKISKNARTGVITQKHFCKCGGEVKMKSTFSGGKIKHFAQCDSCGEKKRRPRDFK